MSDEMAVYLMLGLGLAQLLSFTVSVAFLITDFRNGDARAAYRSNLAGGAGFLFMSLQALVVQQYLQTTSDAWIIWLSGGFFLLVSMFLFLLGLARRRVHTSRHER